LDAEEKTSSCQSDWFVPYASFIDFYFSFCSNLLLGIDLYTDFRRVGQNNNTSFISKNIV
jgi:hypothetical protein